MCEDEGRERTETLIALLGPQPIDAYHRLHCYPLPSLQFPFFPLSLYLSTLTFVSHRLLIRQLPTPPLPSIRSLSFRTLLALPPTAVPFPPSALHLAPSLLTPPSSLSPTQMLLLHRWLSATRARKGLRQRSQIVARRRALGVKRGFFVAMRCRWLSSLFWREKELQVETNRCVVSVFFDHTCFASPPSFFFFFLFSFLTALILILNSPFYLFSQFLFVSVLILSISTFPTFSYLVYRYFHLSPYYLPLFPPSLSFLSLPLSVLSRSPSLSFLSLSPPSPFS